MVQTDNLWLDFNPDVVYKLSLNAVRWYPLWSRL